MRVGADHFAGDWTFVPFGCMFYAMHRFPIIILIAALTMTGCVQGPPHGLSATFSIIAVDPVTGECGVAVASKYPAVGKVVPYVEAAVRESRGINLSDTSNRLAEGA